MKIERVDNKVVIHIDFDDIKSETEVFQFIGELEKLKCDLINILYDMENEDDKMPRV